MFVYNILYILILQQMGFLAAEQDEKLIMLFDTKIPESEVVLDEVDFANAAYVTSDDLVEDNPNQYSNDLFEGDITNPGLTSANVERFMDTDVADAPKGVMHNAVRDRIHLWPGKFIPYTISSQYSRHSRSYIAAAMQAYAKQTCIQFIPKTDYHYNYIHIVPDRGCFSMVGRTGGRQIVSFGTGCIKKGIMIHELMHVVGFFHEQSRADRDSYLQINWHNIKQGMTGQFDKYTMKTIQHLGAPYDYDSVMHYGPKAFTGNGQDTITPRLPGARIGQRIGFSKTDLFKINKLYECDATRGIAVTNPPVNIQPVVQPTGDACRDLRSDCPILQTQDWCSQSATFMRQFCPLTCSLCLSTSGVVSKPGVVAGRSWPIITSQGCSDAMDWCGQWSRNGLCRGPFSAYMKINCVKSCRLCVSR